MRISMDKAQIESSILTCITSGIALNKGAMAASTGVDVGDIERALERMKRKGQIRYDGPTKAWELRPIGRAVAGQEPITNDTVEKQNVSPSQESALTSDAEVGSGNKDKVEESTIPDQTERSTENPMSTENDTDTSKIDAAINAARTRKGQKAPGSETRPRLSPEDKTKRDEDREATKAQRKQERDVVRAQKQAAKQADKKPAHMNKVDKAAAKLPGLDDKVTQFFNELTVNFGATQLASLSAHLTHYNRVKATERALNQKVTQGAKVRITGGEPRFIGLEGTVDKAQRIRCYVTVEGIKKPIYLFTSDVTVLAEEHPASVANG